MYHVMIVDDEFIERDGIRFFLEDGGYDVRVSEAVNGEDALAKIQRSPVDILITDIRMPFMDGLTLARHARARLPRLKILIYTAFGEFSYAQEAIDLRVFGYLLKPIQPGSFHEQMRKVIAASDEERRQGTLGFVPDHDLPGAPPKAPDDIAIDRLIALIHERYAENLTLDLLAQHVFMTPSYISYLFKHKTGTTLIKYITDCRMQRAASLLRKYAMKITDVAAQVGYDNPSYFTSLFKAHFGVSPAQYRRQRRPQDL